ALILPLLLPVGPLTAQAPILPERPVPAAVSPDALTTPLTPAPPPPPPPVPPAPGTDPGPNGWGPSFELSKNEGLFFDATLALVKPTLKNRIGNDTPLNGTSDVMLRVPSVDLDFVAAPPSEVGYRLADSAGTVSLAYNFLVSQGTGPTSLNGVTFDTRTRVNVNTFDLDYGTVPFEFAPRYTLAWRLGARISDVFFDSRIQNAGLLQQASNDFFGSGPHGRLEIERRIAPLPGLALFGRLDGAVLIGQIKQRFRQQAEVLAADDVLVNTLTVRKSQAVPYLQIQAGLSYSP